MRQSMSFAQFSQGRRIIDSGFFFGVRLCVHRMQVEHFVGVGFRGFRV